MNRNLIFDQDAPLDLISSVASILTANGETLGLSGSRYMEIYLRSTWANSLLRGSTSAERAFVLLILISFAAKETSPRRTAQADSARLPVARNQQAIAQQRHSTKEAERTGS